MYVCDATMPEHANVTLEYGPYEACGVVEYRDSRLQGLETQLTRKGHAVARRLTKDWDVVRLVVNGELVFSCNIKDLDYGGDGELDRLCIDAVRAVDVAY